LNFGGYFEPNLKYKRLDELTKKTLETNFWDDKKNSENILNEITFLKNILNKVSGLKEKIESNLETLNLLKETFDNEIKEMIELELSDIEESIKNLELELLLNGEFDKEDAIIEIHPGAGGTESCDWAFMLKRMYFRWAEKHNYKIEIIDELAGEEAGIKSITFLVKGMNAYGYLKSETGVHRLIRISPFDSGGRRHTSFAAILVTPVIDKNITFEIKETDLRIDVYRSGGNGGQGVNTTDSAVRITHIPSKIVVTCQNERSQIQNKEKALEVLKSKLYQLEVDKKNKEINDFKGVQLDINFGSQIRTYTMCPYTLVKDHRTNTEATNVDKVLDGDIDIFIEEYLKVVK